MNSTAANCNLRVGMRGNGNFVLLAVSRVPGMEPDQGVVMKPLVDRPWANILTIESGKGAGKEVMAKAVWGEDNDLIPISVEVTVNDSGDRVIGTINGPFDSIEQAEQLALECASKWYERGNG